MEYTNKENIALIAGGGELPFVMANAIKKRGEYLVCLGIKGEAEKSLKKHVDAFHFFDVTDLYGLKEIIRKEKIKKIIMAGKVHKDILFKGVKLDKEAGHIMSMLSNRGDYHILKAFSHELEKEGIRFLEPAFFLGHLIPIAGILTSVFPSNKEKEDIQFGISIARKIAELDIGQTIVVQEKIVLAVEGIEGTDETIRRGGELGKGGVVIKVTKPHQDLRFDMPVIGIDTIKIAEKVNIRCIAVESHKIIILDREKVVESANKFNISIIAV